MHRHAQKQHFLLPRREIAICGEQCIVPCQTTQGHPTTSLSAHSTTHYATPNL